VISCVVLSTRIINQKPGGDDRQENKKDGVLRPRPFINNAFPR
jgi:hypothetical protein